MDKRSGAALVEFAVICPILLLIIVTIIEFSRVLVLQHATDSAAYEGARAAIVPGANSNDARRAALSLLDANRLSQAVITVQPETIIEETAFVTVSVSVPVSKNSWLPPFWFSKSVIRSDVSLFCERPPLVILSGIPEMEQSLLGLGILGL